MGGPGRNWSSHYTGNNHVSINVQKLDKLSPCMLKIGINDRNRRFKPIFLCFRARNEIISMNEHIVFAKNKV